MLIVPASRRSAPVVAPLPPQNAVQTQLPRQSIEQVAAAPRLEVSSTPAKAAVDAAISFLQSQQQGARPMSVRDAVSPQSVDVDELGMTHVRLNRIQGGVPVMGEQVIVHLDRNGKVVSVTGELEVIPADLGNKKASIDEAKALDIARQDFAKKGVTPEEEPKAQRVIVKDEDGNFRAAFNVELVNMFGGEQPIRQVYVVDASTGEVIRSWNKLGGFELGKGSGQSSAAAEDGTEHPVPTVGLKDDKSLYAGMVDLGTTQKPDGTYVLNDTSRGATIETKDAMNRSRGGSTAKEMVDANDAWGEATDPARNAAGVDAHYGAEMTYDFYKDMFGRNSIDGNGGKITSYVHVGNRMVNAFWDGTAMNYGDGDGRDAGPLVSLDVAGHEMTHGVTEHSAGLEYRGESGGLNEAMSDILGGFGVEWYAMQKNPELQADPFKIGEQVWTPGGDPNDALRYMDDPTLDGYSIDNYSKYASSDREVHRTSGIANNAFSLLVKGGKNRTSGTLVEGGIGAEAALKIYGRALLNYMTPTTSFAQARQACVQAATDLYGADSAQVAKVKESWSAVGVN